MQTEHAHARSNGKGRRGRWQYSSNSRDKRSNASGSAMIHRVRFVRKISGGREGSPRVRCRTRSHALTTSVQRTLAGSWQCPICLDDFAFPPARDQQELPAPSTPTLVPEEQGQRLGSTAESASGTAAVQAAPGGRGGMGSRVLKCGHRFCVQCIQEWTAVQHICPVCREVRVCGIFRTCSLLLTGDCGVSTYMYIDIYI